MPGSSKDNTAVTRLIDEAHLRPLQVDDALFEPPRKATLPPPFRSRGVTAASAPEPMPLTGPPTTPPRPTTVAPRVAATDAHDAPTRPFDQLDADAVEDEADGDAGSEDVEVDLGDAPFVREGHPDRRAAALEPPMHLDEPPARYAPRWDPSLAPAIEPTQIGRMPSPRRRRGSNTKSIAWIAGAFVLGLAATAVIAWPRERAQPANPAANPVPAPVPAAVAAGPTGVPAPAAPAVVPAAAMGAQVAAIDPAAAAGAQVAAIDPAAVDLAAVPTEAAAPAAVAPAPTAVADEPTAAAPAATAPVATAPAARTAPAKPAPRRPEVRTTTKPRVAAAAPRVAAATAAGATVLMIGSKPPCNILIDGRHTGLVTPQRALKVTPGPHRVTLVNRQHNIMETFSVNAVAGKPTKVIKDLTSKMRR